MEPDPQQRQQRQAETEAADEAAAHSNWTWPPVGEESSLPAARGDRLGSASADGGSGDTVATPNHQDRQAAPSGGRAARRVALWQYGAVSVAVVALLTLLRKRRHASSR